MDRLAAFPDKDTLILTFSHGEKELIQVQRYLSHSNLLEAELPLSLGEGWGEGKVRDEAFV